ncbi:GntR family transcriptional regulator [Chryseolinea sp. T2]|uniref:GntR family transcriptional regulator n=1 Tax=Chryseolinea sp. T2 TaxID=3129255 RepID=UPI0030770908
MFEGFLYIDQNSKIPKYQQVVDTIVSDIQVGIVKVGDRIPSINETSEEFFLSRDTVEKAYRILCRRGVIAAVRGKGFYVTSGNAPTGRRVLLVLNKLSDHKKAIYNSFVHNLDSDTSVDLHIHQSDSRILEKIIIENIGKYDHYVIMPHLLEETTQILAAINKIPKDRLLLLNRNLDGIHGTYGCVYEDFENDIYAALYTGIHQIRKYNKLVLVFPSESYYCAGIRRGFTRFCNEETFESEIIECTNDRRVTPGELYIVIEESDLVEVIKKAAAKSLKLGKNIGIIAYNDSPFKEILAGGISVLSTDFFQMGKTMAEMVRTYSREKVKNPFQLIMRNSV